MRKLHVLALCTGLSIAAAACHGKASTQLSKDDAPSVLIDRNWIDRMPETMTDKLHVYRFVPSMGGGVFQDRTLFKGTFELFMFKVEGDHIVFALPETHQKVRSAFTIETVDGPPPFDLKLTIAEDPRGPHEYYGIRAETDRDGKVLDAKLAAMRGER